MKQPTPTQWERFSALRLRLEPLTDDDRREALHVVRSENADDADVVSLLALHFAMPQTSTKGIGSGDRVDDFVLGERLGAGGMGVVYEAMQSLGDASRSVAIKLISPLLWGMAPEQTRQRFADEIKAQAALQYNGLARLYAAGTYEDPATHTQAPYLVMELVHGAQPITDFSRERSLDVDAKLQLFQRICRALQHAHDHRIIHRDLKPDNILIDSEGRPFVVDFGLAQTADAVLPGASMVTSGTIAYMSPEQLSPEFGPISAKTDTYALGVVLYELLTGSKPYETSLNDSLEQLTQVITVQPPKRPRGDVGAELENIVLKALSKQPADRPTVGTLGSQLSNYLSPPSRPSADHAESPAVDETMWSQLRRRGVVRVAAAYSVAAFVVLQVAEITFEPLQFPPWAMPSLIVAAAAGFPIAVLLAWVFEWTPAGVVRDKRFSGVHHVGGVLVGVAAIALGIVGYTLLSGDTTTKRVTSAPGVVDTVLDKSRLSLSVLPLANHSVNQESAFLADGLTRDLTALLSRVPNLRVAPYSSARAITDDVAARTGAADTLNVRYLVSGSLTRRNAQLILRLELVDTSVDRLLWSRRFDEPLDNFFALQDKVIQQISTAIFTEIQASEVAAIRAKDSFNLSAYELIQKAEAEREFYSREAAVRIIDYLERALEIDPDSPQVRAFLAIQLTQNVVSGFSDDPPKDVGRATTYLEEARALAPHDPQVLMGAGIASYWLSEIDKAERYLTTALSIDPNEPHAAALLGLITCYKGRTAEGLSLLTNSMQGAPKHPRFGLWLFYRSGCYQARGEISASIADLRDAVDRLPNYAATYVSLASTECLNGNEAAARDAFQRANLIDPGFGIDGLERALNIVKHPGTPDHTRDEMMQMLRDCVADK